VKGPNGDRAEGKWPQREVKRRPGCQPSLVQHTSVSSVYQDEGLCGINRPPIVRPRKDPHTRMLLDWALSRKYTMVDSLHTIHAQC